MLNGACLPDEVWLNIFDWVAFVPNAYDTHATDLFAYPGPWSQEQILKAIRESLCTKRRIALVCKTWNYLATPLLYKAIPITRKGTLERVLRTISKRDETEIWKARWTVRLDIALKHGAQLPADTFMTLLRYLPGIRIIISRADFFSFIRSDTSVSLIDLIGVARQNALLDTLHVLDIQSGYRPEKMDNLDAIDGLPLRVLRILPPELSLWLGKRITLPEVELLDVPPQLLRSVLSGETPADTLQHLCIEEDFDAVWKVVAGDLSGIGGHIRTLEMDDEHLDSSVGNRHLRTPSPKSFFREIARACPNLDSLIICSYDGSLGYLIDNLPPIKKLGLRFHQTDTNSKSWIKHLCLMLYKLASTSDSLEVVRIIGRPDHAELRKHHGGSLKVVQKFSKTIVSEFGVRLEDWTGRLFHDVD